MRNNTLYGPATSKDYDLFDEVRATLIAPNVWEVRDGQTRYFVSRDAIDMHSDAYPDNEEGYASWCRDTPIVTGLGEFGIPDKGCTPDFFTAIASGLDIHDERRAYALERKNETK